ncbi:hypothetical protein A4W93_15645 [Piscinibacter gummiphilus]|uniref:DUF3192 domain-containing protein n=1 Tax=Piscinibacter gummiphilus TaxID=946333 RepID=A0A1W6LAE4_9BURK|nr:hypothetical protein A4W93_15645 [Piscinibacter gummiphilus]
MTAALLAALLTACATGANEVSLAQLAKENQANVGQLAIGADRAQTMALMGTKTAKTRDGLVTNPFRTEAFKDAKGARYEIHYYVVAPNRKFQTLKQGQMTPLVFKNDTLVGWGDEALQQAKSVQPGAAR